MKCHKWTRFFESEEEVINTLTNEINENSYIHSRHSDYFESKEVLYPFKKSIEDWDKRPHLFGWDITTINDLWVIDEWMYVERNDEWDVIQNMKDREVYIEYKDNPRFFKYLWKEKPNKGDE